MRREFPGLATTTTKGDALRRRVEDAPDDRSRLTALLELSQYHVLVADGVRGLAAAGEARALAMALKDNAALAEALNSASVSQYHRSDYVSAIATAVDARDAARRGDNNYEIAISMVTIGLALLALGANDMAARIADRGLELVKDQPKLLVARIRLLRLQAMITFAADKMADTDALLGEALRLAEEGAPEQRAACHGNWAISLVRRAETAVQQGKPARQLLIKSRHHFEAALRISDEDGDALGATDRICALGVVTFLEGHLEEAERLLGSAMDRARDLDFVRTAVISSFYLARLYMKKGNLARAHTVLRHALSQARRGAAEDMLVMAHILQAEVMEKQGNTSEGAELRATAARFREENEVFRRRAAEDAVQMAKSMLEAS